MSEVTEELVFTLRRKVFSLISSKFQIFNADQELIGYCKQKAFKLKEDIRVYTDTTMQTELIHIKARSIIDLGATYDVVESASGKPLGALRRQALKSILRDEWTVLGEGDVEFGKLKEEGSLAVLRRFIFLFIPQKYEMRSNSGELLAKLNTHFNPFVHKLTVRIPAGVPINPILVISAGILLLAIEGKQK